MAQVPKLSNPRPERPRSLVQPRFTSELWHLPCQGLEVIVFTRGPRASSKHAMNFRSHLGLKIGEQTQRQRYNGDDATLALALCPKTPADIRYVEPAHSDKLVGRLDKQALIRNAPMLRRLRALQSNLSFTTLQMVAACELNAVTPAWGLSAAQVSDYKVAIAGRVRLMLRHCSQALWKKVNHLRGEFSQEAPVDDGFLGIDTFIQKARGQSGQKNLWRTRAAKALARKAP